MGSLRYIPEKPICIHSLSTCTFPVLVIIYINHYLYSCRSVVLVLSRHYKTVSTRTGMFVCLF